MSISTKSQGPVENRLLAASLMRWLLVSCPICNGSPLRSVVSSTNRANGWSASISRRPALSLCSTP